MIKIQARKSQPFDSLRVSWPEGSPSTRLQAEGLRVDPEPRSFPRL